MNLMVIIYICFKKIKYSLMAQWIARMTSDHKVGGSSPSGVALFSYSIFTNGSYTNIFDLFEIRIIMIVINEFNIS